MDPQVLALAMFGAVFVLLMLGFPVAFTLLGTAAGYDRRLAAGIVCSAGTLGTIIPPSIVLILLGSFMQSANIEAQIRRGVQAAHAMTVQNIYLGALAPVGLLLCLYLAYVVLAA